MELVTALRESGYLLPIVLAFGFLLFLLVLNRPPLGLYAFVLVSFSLLPNVEIVGYFSLRIALFVLTAFAFFVHLQRRPLTQDSVWILRDPIFRVMLAFFVWVSVDIALRSKDWQDVYGMLNNIIVFLLITLIVRTPAEVRELSYAMFLGTLLPCAAGWAAIAARGVIAFPMPALALPWSNKVVLPLYCMMGAALGISLAASARYRTERVLVGLASVPLVLMALCGLSRGVTAASAVLLALIALKPRIPKVLHLALAGAVVVAVVALMSEELGRGYVAVQYQAADIQNAAQVSSGRAYLYRAAIKLLPVNPVLGIGWNKFQDMWFSASPAPLVLAQGIPRLHVHCSYLQLLLEIGIIGFSIYVLWTVLYLKRGFSALRKLSVAEGFDARRLSIVLQGILFALGGLLLHSVVDNNGRGVDRGHIILVGALLVGAALVDQVPRGRASGSTVSTGGEG